MALSEQRRWPAQLQVPGLSAFELHLLGLEQEPLRRQAPFRMLSCWTKKFRLRRYFGCRASANESACARSVEGVSTSLTRLTFGGNRKQGDDQGHRKLRASLHIAEARG